MGFPLDLSVKNTPNSGIQTIEKGQDKSRQTGVAAQQKVGKTVFEAHADPSLDRPISSITRRVNPTDRLQSPSAKGKFRVARIAFTESG